MCGIFGYVGKENKTAALILEGLKQLEYRGYDSWGIAIKKPKSKTQRARFIVQKNVGKIGNGTLKPQLTRIFSSIGVGHTRWATHGGVTLENAHPHLDCTKTIAVVHNGIIENYEEIKERLKKHSHKFVSETDTEVVPHLIEENLKMGKGFATSVRDTFNELRGLNAIVVANIVSREIIAAKTGSPLAVGIGKDALFIASDVVAFLKHTRRVIFLDDQEMAILGEGLKIIKLPKGQPLQKTPQNIRWRVGQITKGGFAHFMLKEIFEQPKVIENISQNSARQIERLSQIVKKAFGTYIIGCGTASYAALAGQYLFSRIAKKHINFCSGSEFGYLVDFLTPASLVITLSQSGETIDIIQSAQQAQEKEAKIFAIVNNLGSTLYRLADYKMLLGAGPEKAVASTKAFTAKLAILLLLANSLNSGMNTGRKILKKTVLAINNLLSEQYLSSIKKLVNKIYSKDHIYIIGRGLSYPVALESALKIKEVSYIHAEGFAGGELKHGVIALVEEGTPCLVFAPNDETHETTISGAQEMKSRGGFIIGVSPQNNEVFNYFLPVADCGDGSAIANTVVAQLLAYYLTIKKRLDPDKPRNLAKSVTVK